MSAELDNTTNILPSTVDASEQNAEVRAEAQPDAVAGEEAASAISGAVSDHTPPPESSEAAVHSAPDAAPAESVAKPAETELAATAVATADVEDTKDGDSDEISHEEMGELIEKYPTPQGEAVAEHKPIEGKVVAISELGVFVDIGAKNEGLIPAQEFADNASGPLPGIGQTVEVEKLDEKKDGYVLLSYQRPHRRAMWKKIEEAYRAKAPMDGSVVDLIKGGLVVDIGVRAFLPASQVDLKPQPNLDSWKGQTIPVRVIKMNRKRGNVVVSRRVMLEEENEKKKQEVMGALKEGQVLTGHVKNITDYGVFVDLGGVDGLLHITDLSWGRLKHPSEAVPSARKSKCRCCGSITRRAAFRWAASNYFPIPGPLR